MASSTRLFNSISGIYGRFFNFQVSYYEKIIHKIEPNFNIGNYESILDVGCGTGALSQVLYDKGLKVTAIDPSKGMLREAEKRLGGLDIDLMGIIPGQRLVFPDDSFDIAISSYVAHGLKAKDRIYLYEEMKRVSKDYVIIHDYNSQRALHTTIIEWLEGGDYFNFIKVAEDELRSIFSHVEVIDVDTRATWYICRV